MADQPNIVLVHGAWADGSSWSAAIDRLQADGYRVTAPQFPMTKLAEDVARLRQVLARQDGPTVIAGIHTGVRSSRRSVKMRRMSSDWSTSLVPGLTKANRSEPCWDRDLRPRRSPTSSRRARLRLAARRRLREPLRGRRRSEQGQGDARGAAAAARFCVGRGDGDAGLEVAAVLVPRRRGGPGNPS
jgi:hypothetical protein